MKRKKTAAAEVHTSERHGDGGDSIMLNPGNYDNLDGAGPSGLQNLPNSSNNDGNNSADRNSGNIYNRTSLHANLPVVNTSEESDASDQWWIYT